MEEIQTTLSHIPDNDGNVKILKDVITNLMRVVDKQAQQISLLEAEHADIKQQVANNANSIYEMSDRVRDLERYSRKLCLIFNAIDVGEHPIHEVLRILTSVLQIQINSCDIAACHVLAPGRVAPVIVKFIYHHQRDLAFRRKAWLRGKCNSLNQPIFIDECLAPIDQKIRIEAKEKNVKVLTKKQEVYAYHPDRPDVEPIKIKRIEELEDFTVKKKNIAANQEMTNSQFLTTDWANCETPNFPPPLTRKPSTLMSTKKRKLQLSPVVEQLDTTQIADTIALALVPALLKAMNSVTNVNEGTKADFRSGGVSPENT